MAHTHIEATETTAKRFRRCSQISAVELPWVFGAELAQPAGVQRVRTQPTAGGGCCRRAGSCGRWSRVGAKQGARTNRATGRRINFRCAEAGTFDVGSATSPMEGGQGCRAAKADCDHRGRLEGCSRGRRKWGTRGVPDEAAREPSECAHGGAEEASKASGRADHGLPGICGARARKRADAKAQQVEVAEEAAKALRAELVELEADVAEHEARVTALEEEALAVRGPPTLPTSATTGSLEQVLAQVAEMDKRFFAASLADPSVEQDVKNMVEIGRRLRARMTASANADMDTEGGEEFAPTQVVGTAEADTVPAHFPEIVNADDAIAELRGAGRARAAPY